MAYEGYESPATKLENKLKKLLGATKGVAVAEAIVEYTEAMQRDTVDRANRTGDYSPDY